MKVTVTIDDLKSYARGARKPKVAPVPAVKRKKRKSTPQPKKPPTPRGRRPANPSPG